MINEKNVSEASVEYYNQLVIAAIPVWNLPLEDQSIVFQEFFQYINTNFNSKVDHKRNKVEVEENTTINNSD